MPTTSRSCDLFGIVPLALNWSRSLVGLGGYQRPRAVSLVIRLARDCATSTSKRRATQVASPSAADDEIEVLTRARPLAGRGQPLVERTPVHAGASHELRSPLTVIRTASDNLLNRRRAVGATRSTDRRAALDMEELTEILPLSRASDGALTKAPVLVNEVLAQELASCGLLYADKSLCWTLQADNTQDRPAQDRRHRVRQPAAQCRQLHSWHGAGPRRQTTVTIRDSGMGMSASQLDEVFDPLRSRQHAQGNGIGLSLVKRITERFAWTSTSTADLSGTAVRVDLSQGDARGRCRGSTAGGRGGGTGHMRRSGGVRAA